MDKAQVADLFMRGQDCSQVVLSQFADVLGISQENANRITACFGGGSGIGETCGAVIGALMVIGMKYGHSGPDDMEQRNIMPFLVLLLFATWGIGKIATDTHSLLLCSAFHGIVNFSKRGLLSDTTYLVAVIGIIIFWIVIWYFVKLPKKNNESKGRQGAAY